MDVKLKDHEFTKFQQWLYTTSGINLASSKKSLVEGRLFKRLKLHGLKSYADYFHFMMADDESAELHVALDLLTTNETYFFREPRHFDFLTSTILPQVQTSFSQPFRMWSGASSSGEEPYSIAMTLAEYFGLNGWELIASDISHQMLAKAQSAHYPIARAEKIPKKLLSKYCLKGLGAQEGTFLIARELRDKVQFKEINLVEPFPSIGPFDVIFLRNVMIYFDHPTKCKIMAKMLPMLRSKGYFIVSLSESLNGVTDDLMMISPSIYQKP